MEENEKKIYEEEKCVEINQYCITIQIVISRCSYEHAIGTAVCLFYAPCYFVSL